MEEGRKLEDLAIKKEQEAPKQITEKIPEDVLKKMEELKTKRGQLVNEYLNVAFQVEAYRRRQADVFDKIRNNNETYQQKIKYAFDKLKLKRKKNYRWGFNGKDSFVGNPLPPAPKKNDEKA